MRLKHLVFISLCTVGLLSGSNPKTIEIPLTQKMGYGHFAESFSGISPYPDDENDPWEKVHLNASGAPKDWTEIKYGEIGIDYCQMVYQNYILGNITKEFYEGIQEAMNWQPDTLKLSKTPLKSAVAFTFGKDPSGKVRFIVDANNNLDFSDDESFIPYNVTSGGYLAKDSLVLSKTINVFYERFADNKIVSVSTPLFIVEWDMFMCNFPQHSIANFNGEKIAVCSNNFTNLSYQRSSIAILNDSLKEGDKISPENLVEKNEFIEIKGNIYKNIGVNQKNNTLILEKTNSPKSELYSTQIGYKSFPFEGADCVTETKITSDKLRGKYVLLDFWAVWCGPCLQEIPNLKKLYEKTDREKFEIIGIVGKSPLNALKGIIEKDSITWPQLLSTDSNKIQEKYGVTGYPTTFLLNPDGLIIAKGIRGKELEEKILKLVIN